MAADDVEVTVIRNGKLVGKTSATKDELANGYMRFEDFNKLKASIREREKLAKVIFGNVSFYKKHLKQIAIRLSNTEQPV